MDDFNKRWNDMQRRGDRVRRAAAIIMVLCWITMFAMVVAGAYLLLHPEAIGSFVGQIVAGFNHGRTT